MLRAMRYLLIAALCAACIHEPRVLRLRSDATPWQLGQPYEAHVRPDDPRAIRIELSTAAALRFTCTVTGAGAKGEMAVYGGAGEAALGSGACGELTLRDLPAG